MYFWCSMRLPVLPTLFNIFLYIERTMNDALIVNLRKIKYQIKTWLLFQVSFRVMKIN